MFIQPKVLIKKTGFYLNTEWSWSSNVLVFENLVAMDVHGLPSGNLT